MNCISDPGPMFTQRMWFWWVTNNTKDTGQVTEVAKQLVHFSRFTFWENISEERLHICKVMIGSTALMQGVTDQVNNNAKQLVHIYKSTL